MFADACQIESGTSIETDLCIIGGGGAGITLAREFVGTGTEVCLLNAHVLGLRASSDARYLTHIEIGTLSGRRFKVRAKRFILATGGIENARLMLLSNDVAPALRLAPHLKRRDAPASHVRVMTERQMELGE